MPHQLSTAHDGAGETYDDSTTLVAGTHTQALFLRASTASIGALSSGSKFIGLVALTSGSSGAVIGQVAPSTAWSLGLSTEFIGALSSGSKFIGSVALTSGSSGAVIGLIAPSSAWSLGLSTEFIGALSSGGKFIGIVAVSSGSSGTQLGQVGISSGTVSLSSGLAGSTASIGALSSGGVFIGIVALSSGSSAAQLGSIGISSGTIGLSSGLGASTASIGALSSGGVFIGIVALSSGTITLTTAATNFIAPGSTAGATATTFPPFLSGAVAATTTLPAAQAAGAVQYMLSDRYGRQIVVLHAPFDALNTANLITAANTSQQQLIAAPGANVVAHITAITAWSTNGTTALGGTYVTVYTSSGQADPGRWRFPLGFIPGQAPAEYVMDFDPPLTQLTANNAWWIVSSSSAVTVQVQAQYFLAST